MWVLIQISEINKIYTYYSGEIESTHEVFGPNLMIGVVIVASLIIRFNLQRMMVPKLVELPPSSLDSAVMMPPLFALVCCRMHRWEWSTKFTKHLGHLLSSPSIRSMGAWNSSDGILISKGGGGRTFLFRYSHRRPTISWYMFVFILFSIVGHLDGWILLALWRDHPYDQIYHRRSGLPLMSCRIGLYYFRRFWKDVVKILEDFF